MKSIPEIQRIVNKVYLFFFFFVVSLEYSNYCTLVYLGISLVLLLLSLVSKRYTSVTAFFVFCFLAFLLTTAILFSKYSIINTIMVFIYLFICNMSYGSERSDIYLERNNRDWFYWLGLISITIHLAIQISENGIMMSRFEMGTACWDANMTYSMLFCFFCYCDAKHSESKIWKILALLCVFYSRDERGALLIAILFVLIRIVRAIREKRGKLIIEEDIKHFSEKKILAILAACLVATISFSFFWTYIVSVNGVLSYHEGLNDGSNAVRFRANIYVLEQLKNPKEFLFYGYDNDIRSVLGDTDAVNFNRYQGHRLVQSHNSILNMFVKNGILFTLAYYTMLAFLLKKFLMKRNMDYWLPFFINAMVLHSMFITDYLLFFLMVLYCSNDCRKEKHTISILV